MRTPYTRDDARYMSYYLNQAGGELPGFIGASTQYGNGLGGIFRNLFRMAVPLLKRGFSIAKPHLKTAATNIFGDVVSNIARKTMSGNQDGNGMTVYTRRPLKRPPAGHGRNRPVSKKRKTVTKKPRRAKKKSTTKGRRAPRKRTRLLSKDIFLG